MKLIDVLNKQCEGEIKKGTKLIIDFSLEQDSPETYIYDGKRFADENNYQWCADYGASIETLNAEVELIPPKEKKYLIKVNVSGLDENFTYLNYVRFGKCVALNTCLDSEDFMAHFTKAEMQSIQPVKEFLKDMEGKYEFVEVEENEDD